jgi:hypothetical protein
MENLVARPSILLQASPYWPQQRQAILTRALLVVHRAQHHTGMERQDSFRFILNGGEGLPPTSWCQPPSLMVENQLEKGQ